MTRARPNSAAAAPVLGCLLLAILAGSRLDGADAEGEAARAFKRYQAAKAAYKAQPRRHEAVWQFGRACFEMRDSGAAKSVRAEIAQEGIAACRGALASLTNSAHLHYYLGMNLGALAETRGLSALKLVSEMEQELLAAAALDATIEHAGPDRTLGLLYRDAPAFISVGSRAKAREHLLRAVKLSPKFPENRIQLIDSLLKWNDRNTAREELQALQEKWSAARAEYAGPDWEAAWHDWEAELTKLRKALEEPARLESPRH